MRRAARRKYHYIYKTTCEVTGKYYFGMHSTDNLDDRYKGSGKRLWYSMNKHGEENHICEKLEFFETREKLREREIEIVNSDLLKDLMCMNLQLGGGGGFSGEEHIKKCHEGASKWMSKNWENLEYRKAHNEKHGKLLKERHKKGLVKYDNFTGKTHSEETKQKMKLSQQGKQKGELNSQYGTCWITNNKTNKKIHRSDDIPDGYKLGRK